MKESNIVLGNEKFIKCENTVRNTPLNMGNQQYVKSIDGRNRNSMCTNLNV